MLAHIYPIRFPTIEKVKTWYGAERLGISKNTYFHKTVVALVNFVPKGRIMVLVKENIPRRHPTRFASWFFLDFWKR
jgi:hypothetical protein